MGLGVNKTNATIDVRPKNHCGNTSIKLDKDGEFKMNSLDNLKIKDKIDFMKIDVEGFEKDVLTGAYNTIKNNMPLMWVEIRNWNKEFVFKYFENLNYDKGIKLYESGDYLFIPNILINKRTEEDEEDKVVDIENKMGRRVFA